MTAGPFSYGAASKCPPSSPCSARRSTASTTSRKAWIRCFPPPSPRLELPRMLSESLISIVAPLGVNSGAEIDAFVAETVAVLRTLVTHYEIILVDDGTSESTVARVRALLKKYEFVRFLRLSRHFGEETAIAAGLDVAIGDYVIGMLPDMDPPSLIAQFLERARTDADIVYGVRLH